MYNVIWLFVPFFDKNIWKSRNLMNRNQIFFKRLNQWGLVTKIYKIQFQGYFFGSYFRFGRIVVGVVYFTQKDTPRPISLYELSSSISKGGDLYFILIVGVPHIGRFDPILVSSTTNTPPGLAGVSKWPENLQDFNQSGLVVDHSA